MFFFLWHFNNQKYYAYPQLNMRSTCRNKIENLCSYWRGYLEMLVQTLLKINKHWLFPSYKQRFNEIILQHFLDSFAEITVCKYIRSIYRFMNTFVYLSLCKKIALYFLILKLNYIFRLIAPKSKSILYIFMQIRMLSLI